MAIVGVIPSQDGTEHPAEAEITSLVRKPLLPDRVHPHNLPFRPSRIHLLHCALIYPCVRGAQMCFSLIGTQRPHATVVVGYNTGQIRVFSEMGEPLVTETLHYAPVRIISTML